MSRPRPGQIVLADWRASHRQPDEPSGLRPCIVVEDATLFAAAQYRNVLLVPLTTDDRYATMTGLVEQIDPTPQNGATERSWALAHHVTSTALTRVRATSSRVSDAQLSAIRHKVALSIGLTPAPSS